MGLPDIASHVFLEAGTRETPHEHARPVYRRAIRPACPYLGINTLRGDLQENNLRMLKFLA